MSVLHRFWRWTGMCLVAMSVGAASSTANESSLSPQAAELLFARRVLPVLQEKCFACHGDDPHELQGGLDVRSREGLLRGGESETPALQPGRAEGSLLYQAIRWEGLEMPPKENDRLTAEQIGWVRDWINAGAPWPGAARLLELQQAGWDAGTAGGVRVATSGGRKPEWTERLYDPAHLWAYQPLWRDETGQLSGGGRNPIDVLIEARLREAGLSPAPPADRRTLIRRVTFDLLGLPPTPEEVEAFVHDPAPDEEAFRTVVERLLASPHSGEQWGRHWLDVVRYADSSGYANDYERGNAWRYRDYVVRAFNADKPYDRFIIEQIAGDELLELQETPEDAAESELLIAVGFLRMGPWELTGMEVPKVARQRFLDDVTDAVGQVFLAHMLQCARCHDHKFDPVPTRDYYAIQAAFATTQLAERPAPFLPEENLSGFEERKYVEQRQEFYQRTLRELEQKQTLDAARAWYAQQGLDPSPFEQTLAELEAQRRPGDSGEIRFAQVRKRMQDQKVPPDLIPPRHVGFEPRDFGLERIARKGLERLKWRLERYEPDALSVYSGRTPELRSVLSPPRMPQNRWEAGTLETTCILIGGDPFSPGEPVQPGVLSVVKLGSQREREQDAIAGSPESPAVRFHDGASLDPRHSTLDSSLVGRRLALARWIASPDNPLTARVMVNRLWQWHFGTPLAGNPNNFGATGKRPTHPELLDWLAGEFIRRGWSIKEMHRLILLSDAYRRGSQHPHPDTLAERDPLGTSYAVFRPRRLDAEELRDAMLVVSGELNPALGGIPVCPEMNWEAALQPRMVMGTFAEAWQPSPRPQQRHRRSLYALRLRGQRDPFLEVFNAPSPDLCCEARESSTVTPQVFALFNSRITFERALAWADRLHRESGGDRPTAITRAFQLAFGRPPTAEELAACLDHWAAMERRHESLHFDPPHYPREVLREAVEENTGERFTFVEPLEVAADFVADLQPADASPAVRGLAEVCLVLLNTNEFAYVD